MQVIRNIKWLIITVTVLITAAACSKIDDFFLGKDNTPIPKSLPPATNTIRLNQLWRVDLGAGSAYMHEKLAPRVKGNYIYVALPGGSLQKRSIFSGDLVWKQIITNGISSGPTVAEGIVAVGEQHSGLAVIDQETGKILWKRRVLGEVLARPLIVRGKVVVKTVEGHIYAFDKTGKRIWHWQHGSPELILKASSSPVLAQNHLILVGFADGKLDAVSASSGELAWQKSIVYGQGASDVERLVDIDADPIVDGDRLLLASYQGFVAAVSLENGDVLWKQPASVYQNMTLGNNKLFIADAKSVIWALNPDNGQVLWRQVGLKSRDVTSPSHTPLGIVLGDKTSYVHVLSLSTGALIGQTKLQSAISMSPYAVGKTVYILTVKGQLYALRLVRNNK
ncbi:MAG: outer membrane protein assembly factor BamB [Legionellales bacterium RIFCSPHIGHO2_12_FULL_37_14]|nr:MAG: outer membrane protein assembly factor BamB [Legionellales bacterium RIFCSPHIGHO2_12_FULL_37_14]